MGIFCQEVKSSTAACCTVQELLDKGSVTVEDLHMRSSISKANNGISSRRGPTQNAQAAENVTERLDGSSQASK